MGGFPSVLSTGGPPPSSTSNPQAPYLQLGNVIFLDDEHPFRGFPIPLEQKIAEHLLIGGGKVVQATGTQPEDIVWSGILWDNQASQKLAALKAMQKLGQPVTLSWLDQSFSVVIKYVHPTALFEGKIEYEITCVVVADQSGTYSTPSVASVDSQNQGLYTQAQQASNALTVIDPTNNSGIPSSLAPGISTLGAILSSAGPIAQAPPASIVAITGQVATLQGSLTPYIASLNTTLSAFSGALPSGTQQLLVNATVISNSLSLISANCSIGQAPKTIIVGGGMSCEQLAAQYYGDATLAIVIKSANSLTSMQIPPGAPIVLKLPPATPSPLA